MDPFVKTIETYCYFWQEYQEIRILHCSNFKDNYNNICLVIKATDDGVCGSKRLVVYQAMASFPIHHRCEQILNSSFAVLQETVGWICRATACRLKESGFLPHQVTGRSVGSLVVLWLQRLSKPNPLLLT